MLILILVACVGGLLILSFIFHRGKKFLLRTFKGNNVYIFGYQGRGKDVLNQMVINCFNKPYTSNLDYGGDFQEIALKELHAGNNTFENLIQGKIEKFKPNLKEVEDTFLSDCGIYLPCQYHKELDKRYPTMPVHFALRRQLYNSHIHINSQAYGRVWDKLREQCSAYIKCIWVLKLPFVLICKTRVYEDDRDAENNLKPLKVSLLNNKYEKGLKRVENSARGEIMNCYYIIRKKKIKFDTRAFKKKLLDI